MPQLALRVAPQHSTQYADMAARLAEPELRASPAGAHVQSVEPVLLGGHQYLLVETGAEAGLVAAVVRRLGAVSEAFEYIEALDGRDGPFLRPLPTGFTGPLPRELAEARRYKGKTSEVFTRVLLNLAIFGGAFAEASRLRVVDPLAGGGTTLFVALAAGHDAFGIEQTRRDVETTATFVREFCKESRVPHRELRGPKGERRYTFELGPRDEPRTLVLVEGDARRAEEELRTVPGGARFQALATDLPYGIQHHGALAALLTDALPAWERLLVPGAALALAWDATRLKRGAMLDLVRGACGLTIRDEPPYDALAHRVDRVIRERDVVVAVKPTSAVGAA
jgi:hypothetical protein